jgi:acyl-CoA reductase-like NAD-dependent aldehyde dehydrogenase
MRVYDSLNPFTGQAWAQVPDSTVADVDAAVVVARAALTGPWGAMTGTERARLMRRLAAILERDAAELALTESRDNGKLLREMAAQTAYIPEWLYYYAGLADKLEGRTIPTDKPSYFVYTRREPVGVVAAIVPWNSPLLLMMWKLAPALAAGCTVIVKPSDQTPVSAMELAVRVEEAGFPAGVFTVLTAQGPDVPQALVAHPGVDKVAFTGSTAVGVQVAQSAATHLARTTLELGGKSAQVVFADADLDAVVNGVVAGIFAAGGQTCMAGSRLLVQREVHDELVRRVVHRARTIRLGDPLDPATEMGPVATPAQLATVLGHVDDAVAQGGRVQHGGKQPDLGGLFVEPTVITDVRPDMRLWQEEVFGPVLAVATFDTEDEAIALANDSRYALAAGVWTGDVRRAHRVAHAIRAGMVWINAYRTVSPAAPFGGLGHSGWGRESGIEAIDAYLETKTVWVELSGATRDPSADTQRNP